MLVALIRLSATHAERLAGHDRLDQRRQVLAGLEMRELDLVEIVRVLGRQAAAERVDIGLLYGAGWKLGARGEQLEQLDRVGERLAGGWQATGRLDRQA